MGAKGQAPCSAAVRLLEQITAGSNQHGHVREPAVPNGDPSNEARVPSLLRCIASWFPQHGELSELLCIDTIDLQNYSLLLGRDADDDACSQSGIPMEPQTLWNCNVESQWSPDPIESTC